MRRRLFAAIAASGVACFNGVSIRADEPPREAPQAWPADVAPELKRIQQELGGSIVRGLSDPWNDDSATRNAEASGPTAAPVFGAEPQAAADRQQTAAAVWASDENSPSRGATLRIEALRDAATKLDEMANAFERLELYSQADALRKQAQALRLDARKINSQRRTSDAADAPALAPGVQDNRTPVPLVERPEGEINPPALLPAPDDERPMPENAQPPVQQSVVPAGPGGAELPQLDPVPEEQRREGELSPAPLSE